MARFASPLLAIASPLASPNSGLILLGLLLRPAR